MISAWRFAICWFFSLFSPAAIAADSSLSAHRYDALPTFSARGWSETDFSNRECRSTGEEGRVCRYVLLQTAEVAAFASGADENITAVALHCPLEQCDTTEFGALAVYLMRGAGDDPDEVLQVLLAGALAKSVLVAGELTLSATKDEEGFIFIMQFNR
ncbi:hypothetical protein [Rhizobium sp. CSW-27]|uniref:hypothetical protein n=1 Tax=Rhizobium sp. CSW-27 TaxID=2839985 RepID=UPI001C02118C|nr:hypothetical protein [Rhizobium sp. CSW-27]MBT9373409.1 hypothetical protein [Rhizobium sp. CSW-27]